MPVSVGLVDWLVVLVFGWFVGWCIVLDCWFGGCGLMMMCLIGRLVLLQLVFCGFGICFASAAACWYLVWVIRFGFGLSGLLVLRF